ncbi:MAG: hypothetical protein IPH44_21820 [Myxococcales bacterium]|nr:hypothetical protein [Myxococcales bacterium]MBK7191998.1 hypothetical protein [Myxococcales bacterium]MBP6842165.1 hypothetical protein [Kofleriaceae bacterium]
MRLHAAIASLALVACSPLTVPRVSTTGRVRNRDVARTCSTSLVAPVFDVVGLTVLGVVPAIAGLPAIFGARPPVPASQGDYLLVGVGLLLGGVAIAVGFGAAASYGFTNAERCADERAKPPPPPPDRAPPAGDGP